MNEFYRFEKDEYLKRKKRRVLTACLCLLVAAATVCALMLPADTLEQKITVYQINKYSQAKTALVYGGSVREKLGSGMSFTYWDAVFVERSNDGRLYTAKYITADGSKLDYRPNTADGFILLLYNMNIELELEIGQIVTVGFDYKSTVGYDSLGYGTVVFGSDNIDDPSKDNSSKLSVIEGANTKELIEVNLYDYGDNINTLYNSSSKYPGFQQEGGVKNVGTEFSRWASFNFGNSITADLDAGNSKVTVSDGTGINATTDGANRPISGAMMNKLGADGYPALADGTSLSYLFSENTYAEKKNRTSVNGLFLHDDVTGAYTFNSRENHAQFNPENDTFTLYEQMITSNFMMYPFGNFLPFNDIVHNSTQTSTIGKSTLSGFASSALNKYNSGYGSEYGTLSTQLNNFTALMDKNYSDGWRYSDCMNEYFKASGLPKIFDPNNSEGDRQLVDGLYSIDFDVPTDFYFGMEMKMNFMQPKNGLTGKDRRQPMVFYFTGDDDVWVYIDGVMFLDLSGIHRHVGGEIDFANGTVKYYELDTATGDIAAAPYKTVRFAELVDPILLNDEGTFNNYSMHSFNFYYVERGSGSGVCRMNFNFPLIHENSISVTKDIDTDEGDRAELLGNPDFKFQAISAEDNSLFIGPSTQYTVFDISGNKLGTGVTDKDGVFALKAGQTAVFDSIAENSGRYYVRELLDANAFAQYGDIKVDGSTQTVDYGIIVGSDSFNGVNSTVKDISDGSTVFCFNNIVTFKKLGSLSVTKTVSDMLVSAADEMFEFSVKLDGVGVQVGTEYTVSGVRMAVTQAGKIRLSPNETAVFSGILAGSSFEISETQASAAGYSVAYYIDGNIQSGDKASGIIKAAENVEIRVNNAQKGVSVSIPVKKSLDYPDGNNHSYTFLLEQVTDSTGDEFYLPMTTRELTLEVSGETAEGSFIVNYPSKDIDTFPCEFYYRITEKEDAEDKATLYDKSVYVVRVTVESVDGEMSAAVTELWKDGAGGLENILFLNQIIRYELPSTGGIGTEIYFIAGALLTAVSSCLLYLRYKRKRESGM